MTATRRLFIGIFIVSVLAVIAIPSSALFNCKHHNLRLLQLLNLLCNTTQPTIQLRDACQGCFLRTGTLPPGPPQIISLSQCATIYLTTTTYQMCAVNLAAVVVGIRPTEPVFKLTACSAGYCEFVRCVRRINSHLLINACFVASLINRNFNIFLDRINFYTNTTACILARTRCSTFNPITGELQEQFTSNYPNGITNSVGTAGYFPFNAIQIGSNGDIKIIAFPPTNVAGDFFCARNVSLDQSVHDGQTCLFAF